MADKIVQLVDSEDNNIYPVAGALKDGSVTTSTINDGAVTADKIDFTTMKKWVPDYANKSAINLWSGANLTATIAETGFVAYCVNAYASNATQSVRVLIDNVVIAKDDTEARSPNNSVIAAVSGVAPVCAGNTITAFKNSGSFNIIECYFIPGKWVS